MKPTMNVGRGLGLPVSLDCLAIYVGSELLLECGMMSQDVRGVVDGDEVRYGGDGGLHSLHTP